jgi:hypothetical protein
MDIPRAKSVGRNKKLRNILLGVAVIPAVSLITFGISYLKPTAPSIARSAMLIDTVKRGPMLRQVRGVGTLVPEEGRIIAASTKGRLQVFLLTLFACSIAQAQTTPIQTPDPTTPPNTARPSPQSPTGTDRSTQAPQTPSSLKDDNGKTPSAQSQRSRPPASPERP